MAGVFNINLENIEECERMFVSAIHEDNKCTQEVLQQILVKVPNKLHPDTFGNLLVAFKQDYEAVMNLATNENLRHWISTWKAPEVEGWVGGVGGRIAALSSILQAITAMLTGPNISAATDALDRVLTIYGFILKAHARGIVPYPHEIISPENVAQMHKHIKRWRWVEGKSLEGIQEEKGNNPEDLFLHLYVAQALSIALNEVSVPQPALALVALLSTQSVCDGKESDLQVAMKIFREDVLLARTPVAAKRDVHLILSSLCPPDQLKKQTISEKSTLGIINENTHQETNEVLLLHRSWTDSEKMSQKLRYAHATSLFMHCVSAPSLARTAICAESLEVVFRIAGVTANKQLFDTAVAEFNRQAPSLTSNNYRRVVSSAFLALRDWTYSGSPGPATPTTTATEYFPTIGHAATHVRH